MEEKICCFFGHRRIEEKEELFERIIKEVEDLITNKGVNVFLFGGYGEFDWLCYEAVTVLLQKNPAIKRIFCYADEKEFLRLKRKGHIKGKYEEYRFLSLDYNYWYTRVYYRNCEMINMSDIIIFYAKNTEGSGAYKVLRYAISKKKVFKNLAKE